MPFGAKMRALFSAVAVFFVITTAAQAQDVDYARIAQKERGQLAKCFSDVLTVMSRHNITDQALRFLEAGCAGEIGNYRVALRSKWPAVSHKADIEKWFAQQFAEYKDKGFSHFEQSLFFRIACQEACMETPTSGITMIIAAIQEAALQAYKERPISFCTGDSCVLDAYRRCFIAERSNELAKRSKPRVFERVARQKCSSVEGTALLALNIDFDNVQRRQLGALTDKTREMIEGILVGIRKEAVVSYSEDLTRVEPGRKSCRTPMCGENRCISLEEDTEYKCAIRD